MRLATVVYIPTTTAATALPRLSNISMPNKQGRDKTTLARTFISFEPTNEKYKKKIKREI